MDKQIYGPVMKSAVALCVLLACGARSLAAGEGPFFNVGLGAAFVDDFTVSIDDTPGLLKTDIGERLSLAFGYTLYSGPNIDTSVQFETGVIHNSMKSLTFFDEPTSAEGDLYQVPFLVDLLYHFHIGGVKPYVGVGGGGVYMRTHLSAIGDFPYEFDSSDTDWAVQALAGLRFHLHEGGELGVAYKFLATFPQFNDYVGIHSISLEYVLHF
jgi:opacity protein-like surface antigen